MDAPSSAANPIQSLKLDDTVYGKEVALFAILAVLASLLWLLLIVGTLGVALIYLLLFFLIYLFTHSAFIAHLRGNAVEITPEQFPELHRRLQHCCQRLNMVRVPKAYLWSADGMLNAFATRFLARDYVVLTAAVVDALASKPDGINFYIGHELGHLRRAHLIKAPFLALVSWLPLIGPAYSRACESTCDLHGLHCCDNLESATDAMAVLAAGVEQWRHLNVAQYLKQASDARGFWMSLHELTGDYPWLAKRMARVVAASRHEEYVAPGRNPLAYLFALFTPRLYLKGGGLGAMIVVVAIIGILAAIAIPAYQQFQQKAEAARQASYDAAMSVEGESAEAYAPDTSNYGDPEAAQRDMAERYQTALAITSQLQLYRNSNGSWPSSLQEIALSSEISDRLGTIEYYGNGEIGFYGNEDMGDYQPKPIYLSPLEDEAGAVTGWNCESPEIPDSYLNPECQG